jgi:Protein of unknown function (DUF416)
MDLNEADVFDLQPESRRLREELRRLSDKQQIAFGLGCCERLYPAYADAIVRHDMSDVLRPILDQIWEYVEGIPKSAEQLEDLTERANSAGVTDEVLEPNYLAISNCIGATYRASSACLESTTNNVMWAWTWCEDVVYQLLRDRLLNGFMGLVEPEMSRELQAIIRADPVMIREHEFALRLLHFLSGQAVISRGIKDAVTRIALADRTMV